MAITRREFVTTLGALAAAVGASQADISKLSEAFAMNSSTKFVGTGNKPRVVWVHGAECTGCSTSLLSFLEDTNGEAVFGTGIKTGAALGLAGFTQTLTGATRGVLWGAGSTDSTFANVADVVIDLVDLQYHETIMGMGGDLAAQWLNDFALHNTKQFVLVVEGALADKRQGGAWNDATGNGKSWCSIGVSDDGTSFENDFADTVLALASQNSCAATIAIGQCASYGGYPGCKPQISAANAGGFDPTKSQSGAMGVYDYLTSHGATIAAGNVINVPGCPTNPWWFGLTVVIAMVNIVNPGAVPGIMDLDYGRRLKAVYPTVIHGPYCPHIGDYNHGLYALKAGDPGCLQKLGCKGIATNSLCAIHGWNNQQPQNAGSLSQYNHSGRGGHCTVAGAPCMGCTEKGYPDSFVPFLKR